MARLPIVQYPNPVLSEKAEVVTEFNEELKQLASDMAETMYAAPGVGLAAPQVGVLKRIITIDVSEDKNDLYVLVNPEIIAASADVETVEEGCLSLPGLYENVTRPQSVRVRATTLEGQPIEFDAKGILAICVQHEIDHLDGIVFIDHLSRLKKDRACTKLRKLRLERKRETAES